MRGATSVMWLNLIPRWVLAAAVAALFAASLHLKLDNVNLTSEIQKEKTHVAQLKAGISESKAAAAEQARRLEGQAREAEKSAQGRERVLAADARAARSELDRLRTAVEANRSAYSLRAKPSALAPNLDVADPIPELFIQCSRRLVEVALDADQWKSDAIKLYEAWPTTQ